MNLIFWQKSVGGVGYSLLAVDEDGGLDLTFLPDIADGGGFCSVPAEDEGGGSCRFLAEEDGGGLYFIFLSEKNLFYFTYLFFASICRWR